MTPVDQHRLVAGGMERGVSVRGYERETKQVTHLAAGVAVRIEPRRECRNFGCELTMAFPQRVRALRRKG